MPSFPSFCYGLICGRNRAARYAWRARLGQGPLLQTNPARKMTILVDPDGISSGIALDGSVRAQQGFAS